MTIDLNGFTLQGVPDSLPGIAPTIIGSGLAVSNGHVTGWGDIGVAAVYAPFPNFYSVEGTRFEDLTVTSCLSGIRAGDGGVVKNCVARSCTNFGMIGGNGSVFESCTAQGNGGRGFVSQEGCTFANCSAQGNTGVGFDISGQGDTLVTGCDATRNTLGGIKIGQQSFVTNCQIVRNTGSGVTTPALAFSGLLVVRGCFISANSGWGIDFSLVVGGSAYQNFLEANTSGAINNDGNDDTPISPTTAGAGPWDNIGF